MCLFALGTYNGTTFRVSRGFLPLPTGARWESREDCKCQIVLIMKFVQATGDREWNGVWGMCLWLLAGDPRSVTHGIAYSHLADGCKTVDRVLEEKKRISGLDHGHTSPNRTEFSIGEPPQHT